MSRRTLPALLLIAAACAPEPVRAPPPPSPQQQATQRTYDAPALRLSSDVAPVRYEATLTLVPSARELEGVVDIDFTVAKETSFFWIHGTQLTVREARVEARGRTVPVRVVTGNDDFLGIELGEPIPAGAARLHVAYRGVFSDKDDRGVFKEKEDGRDYLFSQFENIEARRAFPCFDEPGFKTPWQLTLRVPEGDVALSNTPALSEAKEGGMKVVRFAETKPLPSYLVAFAVGPFEIVDAGTAGRKKTPIRIVTPRGRADRAAYPVKLAPALLDTLERFFEIPYPYEKLDVVAVPQLASFGAMENAGLITYAESMLLARPEEDTLAHQRACAETLAHEMAHQWFGDLVTMAWWDDIWLNEAFASWMEERTLAAYQPAWRWELVRSRSTARAMHGDSLVSARQIRQAIAGKDDIQNAFDEITYQKGAAVIGMFERFAGVDGFRRGIRRYLGQHAHANATSADFLAAISAETKPEIGRAITTFLDQPGVPLVRGELACTKGQATVKLTQQRYLPVGTKGDANQVWQVPVCLRWGGPGQAGKTTCTLLTERTATVRLDTGMRCPQWVSLNAEDTGYYHAGYTPKGLAALLDRGFPILPEVERLGVVRDVGALMASGDLSLEDGFSRLPALAKDPSPAVLEAAMGLLEPMRRAMVPDDLRPAFQRFVDAAFGARARAIGWTAKPGEDDRIRLLRPRFLQMFIDRTDDRALSAEADALARRWIKGEPADEDLVETALVIAARHGDRKLFDDVHAAARAATDDARRRRLLHALASFTDPALVRASLEIALSDEFDPRVGMDVFWQDEHAQPEVLALLRARWDAVVARLPAENQGILPWTLWGFCDERGRAEVEKLFAGRIEALTGGPRNLAKVLERIALCDTQRKANEPGLRALLAKQKKN